MSNKGWHISRYGETLILARRPGARTGDPGLWADTRLPAGLRSPVLAHEMRKDLWRALQNLRGFSPVVEIRPCKEEAGLFVRAGGLVDHQPPAALVNRLRGVLEDKANRARWIAHAGRSAR